MDNPIYLYRCFTRDTYEDETGRFGSVSPVKKFTVSIERFVVVKTTERGVWITDPSLVDFKGAWRKFVLLTNAMGEPTKKRWACLTPEEALVSYRLRMAKHIQHLKESLTRAEGGLRATYAPRFRPKENFA